MKWRKMILANRRITVREVDEDLNISIGSCHSIFINDLGMRRVAAKFVPKLLNCDQKQHRMNIANEMLDSVRDDPNLLQRIITGDEAWVYGYDVETKGQSSQWKLPHETRPKKARQVRSNVKVLLTVFFDCRDVVHHPPFSENEVKLTAFKFGKRKSPGPEGIDNTVVKALLGYRYLAYELNRIAAKACFACRLVDRKVWVAICFKGIPTVLRWDPPVLVYFGYCFYFFKSNTSSERPETSAQMVITLLTTQQRVTSLWELETIGIRDPTEVISEKEKNFLMQEKFREKICRDHDGRYLVSLPWKEGIGTIPNNLEMAKRRLVAMTQKLTQKGQFDPYDEVFRSWFRENLIEVVDGEDIKPIGHYLPHRPIYEYKVQSETTPIRPVYDASCKASKRSLSLNECLETGPNLIERLPEILIRFEEKKIGAIANIRKAFQTIGIDEKERDYLRFLWWDEQDPSKIRTLRHTRVVFGLTCSPFILAAVMKYHLESIEDYRKPVADVLKRSFYVDNLVFSVDEPDELERIREIANDIMDEVKMTLREWEYGAELVAIRVALRVCAEKNFSPDRLYSDCTSALVAINLVKGQLAHQIIQELEMITRVPELHWVRGHGLIEAMAAALQKFDIDPKQQLYTPKIVDIAAAVMEMHGYI
ncbi:hypothetical protein LAZ67_X003247 [Cordylochernes scorpioides]|uniref:Reverse transcriptase domain-containing protein n=1 Tax=Cordylochernes scorpioides TaxID=51811 RepID=A0ABY6LU02_9ARAC|nr:hypothetical protein LAZ67_X003247 [Cordylochernes scorpioides]